MKFLFWNISGKPLANCLAEIVQAKEIDIIITAENVIPSVELVTQLNAVGIGTFIETVNHTKWIKIFTRISSDRVQNVRDEGRISVRKIQLFDENQITLIAVHCPSKLWRDERDQSAYFTHTLRPLINEVESEAGHKRTLLVGDLNANPFEDGMIGAMGLHAVSSRDVARTQDRVVDKKVVIFFIIQCGHFLATNLKGRRALIFAKGRLIMSFFGTCSIKCLSDPKSCMP